jgi:hypothetical protein
MEDATPTFRRRVKRRSRTAVAVSMVDLRGASS